MEKNVGGKRWEKRFSELIEMTTSGNIVVSGGCFLNCVANYKMKKKYAPCQKVPLFFIVRSISTDVNLRQM